LSNYGLDHLDVMENPFLSLSSREKKLITKSYKYRKKSKKKMIPNTVFRTAENTKVEIELSRFCGNTANWNKT